MDPYPKYQVCAYCGITFVGIDQYLKHKCPETIKKYYTSK